jgi:hypothetical protein
MGRQMGERWARKDQEALERWERETSVEGDFIVVVVEEEVDC